MLQATSQAPALHDGVPWTVLQLSPQAPQFAAVPSVVSQPVVLSASQSSNPNAQTMLQTPSVQFAVPFT